MNKHTNELLAMRDNELTSAYKKFLKEEFLKGGKINRRKVIERTITESRPHFHVSFEHAYKVLSTIRNHGTKNCFKLTLHQQMWQELLTLVEEELTSRPYLSMGHALSRVLAEKRASRFYLSHDYCYKRLYKIEN
ncbi:MAG: hypothetical protein IJ328_07805 [Muribaculaceae bacterium]|nr:hypothetical protein [Muribaculaceae bacterium]